MTELVQKLKEHVTVFSAAIPTQCEHGDEVKVGGKVTAILNLSEILQESNHDTEGIYITLDDGVGETQLCLPPRAYELYLENFGELAIGDVLLAQGRVHYLDTTHTFEGSRGKKVTVDKHPEDTIRVLTYLLVPFSNEKPKKVIKPKSE